MLLHFHAKPLFVVFVGIKKKTHLSAVGAVLFFRVSPPLRSY